MPKKARPGIAAKKQPQSKALLSTNSAATVPSSLTYQQEQIAQWKKKHEVYLSAVIVMCSLYNIRDLLFVYFARISMY